MEPAGAERHGRSPKGERAGAANQSNLTLEKEISLSKKSE